VEVADLRKLGLHAIQEGYMDRSPRLLNLLADTPAVQCFPNLPANWNQIDGTIPYSDQDQAQRFEQGLEWHENSCALDCIIVAALLLDAGRRRVDQIDQEAMKKLGPLPRALLYIIRKPWGELLPKTLNALRDDLRTMLAVHDPGRFPTNQPCGLLSVADELFAGLPQLHATWTYALACCEAKNCSEWQYSRTAEGALKTRVLRGLPTLTRLHVGTDPPPPRTLQAILDAGFAKQPLTTSEAEALPKCDSAACSKPFKIPVLVDRLPPVLILTEDNLDIQADSPTDLYSEVSVRCMGAGLIWTRAVRYRIEGYIVCQNKNHFTLCWQRRVPKSEYFQALAYDGLLKDGKFVQYPKLKTAYPKGAVLALVFLTRVDG